MERSRSRSRAPLRRLAPQNFDTSDDIIFIDDKEESESCLVSIISSSEQIMIFKM